MEVTPAPFGFILVKTMLVEGNQYLSISERIVEDLIMPLLNKGYHLYMDHW